MCFFTRDTKDKSINLEEDRIPLKRKIAVASQKGGVGKSTTAVNIAAYLSSFGYRTILIDMDPQSNSTTGLGINTDDIDLSVYSIVSYTEDPNKVILDTGYDNLKVIPSTGQLENAETELVSIDKKEYRLGDAISRIEYDYDFIIIDCCPHLGILTINALAAAEEVIIPVQCEFYALEGTARLIKTIDLVRVNFNRKLEIAGAILTMYSRTRISNQAVKEIKKYFSHKIYNTIIPRNIRLSEAPSTGKPIMDYDPWCKGAKAYEMLARELVNDEVEVERQEVTILPRRIIDFWDSGSPPRHAAGKKRKLESSR